MLSDLLSYFLLFFFFSRRKRERESEDFGLGFGSVVFYYHHRHRKNAELFPGRFKFHRFHPLQSPFHLFRHLRE